LPGVAYLPSDRKYVTDNAAMIAAAGYWRFLKEDFVDWKRIEVRPEWGLK
jgi:tRNA A37 threonylcarbamoyltransferase TsaD